MPSVIVFGASGFVGAPYTKALKQAHPDWSITAYVRSPQSESQLNADRVIVGDFSDFEKVKAASAEHDIAVNAGNSFTADPVAAIIAGQKSRGTKGKVIHISGGGNFIDFGTSGGFNSESKVWNDANEDDINAIHKEMFNGQSDTLVLEAGNGDDGIDTYIVCPSVVYGGASISSPVLGVGYKLITGNAKPLGYVPYVGDGTAVLSTCHILDLVDFLVKISDVAAQGPAESSPYSRFYMLETSRVAWKDLATELAKMMHARGIFSSPVPKSVEFEQAGEGEVKYLVGSNMLMKGDRAAAMGFKAKYPSILTQIHEDLKELAI
ncbi:NAD(P)-binding domain protein [Fusarium tjaetaba]|uniref:NAD(P)-binding domain protein n=1 Tax=Fusarium tjaetaba TaxID=1567544 RepID=A0A8H5QQV4_9HYPO|nr:NAD(P)-binding domain protein [Fusarium tjaetaba]KAF5619605.1 NAD(P)-binding domain protein [Fusarium tjaetaba]